MGDILDWVLSPIHRFLMRPSWEGKCLPDYTLVRSNNSGDQCVGTFPQNTGFRRVVRKKDDTDDEKEATDEIWQKPDVTPDEFTVAHGKTCPAGTFGSNGLCYRQCPDGFQMYKEVLAGKTYIIAEVHVRMDGLL